MENAQAWRERLRSDNFMVAATLGLVPGVTVTEVIGFNEDIDQGVIEDLIPQGGTYVFPDNTGEEMEIVSDNAGDIGQLVRLALLDADFKKLDEFFVVLNGTTPVAVPGGPFTRLNGAVVISATPLVGQVTIQGAGGGLVFGIIRAEDMRMNQGVYTVPDGCTGFITRVQSSLNKAGGADANAIIRFRNNVAGLALVKATRFGLSKEGSGNSIVNIEQSQVTPGRFDIVVEVLADGTNTDVTGLFTIMCFDDELLAI